MIFVETEITTNFNESDQVLLKCKICTRSDLEILLSEDFSNEVKNYQSKNYSFYLYLTRPFFGDEITQNN